MRIWKEAVVTYFNTVYYPGIRLERLMEISIQTSRHPPARSDSKPALRERMVTSGSPSKAS
jgi:hypothetical protein